MKINPGAKGLNKGMMIAYRSVVLLLERRSTF